MTEIQHSLTYRRDIDGMRAIAVLSVLIFHINPKWLPGGFVGVDIFFVISGFLITSIISRDITSGTFSFLKFYQRRIVRLYPALLLTIAATFSISWFLLYSSELTGLAKHIKYGLLYVINFTLHGEIGYFDTSADFKPLLHLWSLAVEEQFYILFPCALAVFSKKQKHLFVSFALLLASLAYNFYLNHTQLTSPFYLSPARFWQIAFGSVTALIPVSWLKHFTSHASRYSVLGIAALAVALFFTRQSNLNPTPFALLPVLGTCLLLITGTEGAFISRRVLSVRPLVAIGLASYPLYLWHWPLLSLLRISAPENRPVWLDPAVGLISLALAGATYLWIEKPFRTAHSRVGRNASILLAASICFITYAQVVIHNSGFDDRPLNRAVEQIRSKMTRMEARSSECLNEIGASAKLDYCLISNVESKTPIVALIGDSHAHAIFPGLAKYFESYGVSLILMANSSCPMLLDVNTEESQSVQSDCEIKKAEILNYLASNKAVKAVIVANRGVNYIERKGFGPAEPTPLLGIQSRIDSTKNFSAAELFKFGMNQLIQRLIGQGHQVYYLLQVPEIGLNPDHCHSRMPILDFSNASYCKQSLEAVLTRHAPYRQAVEKLQGLSGVFDPIPNICSEGICTFKLDGEIIYADDDHLNPEGAIQVIEKMRPKLDVYFAPSSRK